MIVRDSGPDWIDQNGVRAGLRQCQDVAEVLPGALVCGDQHRPVWVLHGDQSVGAGGAQDRDADALRLRAVERDRAFLTWDRDVEGNRRTEDGHLLPHVHPCGRAGRSRGRRRGDGVLDASGAACHIEEVGGRASGIAGNCVRGGGHDVSEQVVCRLSRNVGQALALVLDGLCHVAVLVVGVCRGYVGERPGGWVARGVVVVLGQQSIVAVICEMGTHPVWGDRVDRLVHEVVGHH